MKISIVAPVYNEENGIAEFCKEVLAVMGKVVDCDFELLLVNDGSGDGSLERIKQQAESDPHIRYLSFTRNFGHQAALRAGLANATGDAVISMDSDLQHPPRLLPDMIRKWQEGYDIVYTIRKSGRETGILKRLSSKGFYFVLNRLSGLNLEEGAADFRLLDAKVVEIIRALPEPNLFLRGFIQWSGFRVHSFEYTPDARFAGSSKYSLHKMISLALHGITQFSVKPLRLANILGFLSALSGMIYGFFAVWQHAVNRATVSGWTSVIVCILIMGGMQLLILGIIGEYLGRAFIQAKHRPDYIIKEMSRS